MLLLALDTATTAVAVAVHDGTRTLAEVLIDGGATAMPRHGELLAPALEQVMADAAVGMGDLTHVVCGVGPGPFTGLRVGLVTAAVLARTQGVPVVGVCTLDALARQALQASHGSAADDDGAAGTGGGVAVATDARRREVYLARYDASGRRTWGPRVLTPADAVAGCGGLPVVGPGALLHAGVLRAAGVTVGGPVAVSAAALAAFAAERLRAGDPLPDPAATYVVGASHDDGAATMVPWGLLPAVPLYLRRPDAVPSVPVPVPGSRP